MNKRTDRHIALGGMAVIAIVLPALLIGLSHGGKHKVSHGASNAAGTASPGVDGPGQPSDVPATDPVQTPPTQDPGTTNDPSAGGQNPDTTPGLQGQQPHLPPTDGRSGYQKADDGALITSVRGVRAGQFDVTVATPALATSVQIRVMVPASWTANASRTWPVVYAYHGGNNNYTSWTVDSHLAQVAAHTDAMIVMPEGGRDGSYTDWYNGGRGGTPEWETFHTTEVIQLMERNFHAGASRAAIGLSSGGQGAITYAERHPGLFKYAASYSGALNITGLGMPTVLMSTNSRPGVDPANIWGDPVADRSNWGAHDAAVNVANLRGIGVFVSAGDGRPGPYDDPNTAPWDAARLGESAAGRMTVNFVKAADDNGIPVATDLYGPGTHKWVYWDRELVKSWPAIVAAIGAGRS